MEPKLISTIICEDAVMPAGLLTLYNLLRDHTLFAGRFPARCPQVCVATTWLGPATGDFTVRVVIIQDAATLLAEASATFSMDGKTTYYLLSTFRPLVIPEPGTYQVQVWLAGRQVAEVPLRVIGREEK